MEGVRLMRIMNNLSSMNTLARLNMAQTGMTKSLEKLSSGLRIGRASDDAAGMGISEKMRGQIKGLNRASNNAQEAISLVQTAEGALGETHSILQRMRELSVQAASDTATNTDRKEIQKEVDSLAKEITRISNTTEFNTKNLLSGAFGGSGTTSQKFQIGANTNQNISLSISAMDASTLGVAGSLTTVSLLTANASGLGADEGIITEIGSGLTASSYDIDVDQTAASLSSVTQSDATAGAGATAGTYTGARDKTYIVKATTLADAGAGVMEVTAAEYSTDGGLSWSSTSVTNGAGSSSVTLDGVTLSITDDAQNTAEDTWTYTATAEKSVITLTEDGGANIGTGVTVYADMASITIGDASADKTLTLTGFTFTDLADGSADITLATQSSTAATVSGDGKVTTDAEVKKGVNVSTQTAANNAITSIDNAINTVSAQRSNLGAIQNRLEHTIANLNVTSENMAAAESRIRDVDMAKEMSEFTKNQILSQASTAMLAQANQVPQGILKLLG